MARSGNILLNTIRKRIEEAGFFKKDCFRFELVRIMPMKQWCRKFQPIQLYIILLLTMLFFIAELIYSHLTHAITLLMNSYQMLCNICALTGCIITMKNVKNETTDGLDKARIVDKSSTTTRINQEAKLKNTFGWARIEVISMLICCIFLASFSISVFVEALQTLCHIDHLDEMHHPISVMCIGVVGLLINGICYLLIGGYTFHQGSFLFVNESGDVILNRVIVPETVTQGGRRLSRTRTQQQQQQQQQSVTNRQRQGFREMCRDILGCVLVIICSLLVYFTEKNIAKYIDPVMAFISSASLLILSYPYMKESCLILLQTIPATINIDALKKDLLNNFKDIVNIHDFHVWQLTTTKIISTVHIIFQNQQDYHRIMDDIKEFLVDYGITQVTIQPEFFTTQTNSLESCKTSCVLPCQDEGCAEHHCCFNYEEKPVHIFGKKLKRSSTNSLPDLRSIKIIDKELSKTTEEISISESHQS